MTEAVLQLEDIVKSFGATRAVDGVSIGVARDEFFSLLGPSGSGKTTLLRIIAGLETPDRGRVLINGEDVTRLPPYARRLGMVFQDFLLFPHRTVAENVAFPLKMQGASPEERKRQLDWVLDLVHLSGLEARYPHQLSGGQKQRVALARGLVSRPSVLLLDEPLANLDRELRKEMEIEVRRFQIELDIPFIYVTHNQEEALTMSDRMAVMNRGLLEQVGPKLELYEKPRTAFVAAFVGSANRLHGEVRDIDGATARIAWHGHELLGVAPAGAAVGDPVDYFIKSERIAITPAAEAPATEGQTRLDARLRDIIFKGQYSDYIVALDGGNELVVSGPPALEGLKSRADVVLHWPAEAADVFAAQTT
jgi:putative spermidine/putrescine transport system ATP-binding protein/spermidine/putrescine transport system ATP-binding protein